MQKIICGSLQYNYDEPEEKSSRNGVVKNGGSSDINNNGDMLRVNGVHKKYE